jgi:hypothetical protein
MSVLMGTMLTSACSLTETNEDARHVTNIHIQLQTKQVTTRRASYDVMKETRELLHNDLLRKIVVEVHDFSNRLR